MTTPGTIRLASIMLIGCASLALAGCDWLDNDNDDTGPIDLTVTSAAVAEGNFGTTTVTFEIGVRPGKGPRELLVSTFDNSATAGSDYLPLITPLTIPAGESSRTIDVTVLGDEDFEADETFVLRVAASAGKVAEEATGIGTIGNDDLERDIQVGASYTYDELNRLVRVDYDNGKSVIYAYDAAGNITNVDAAEP